MVSTNLFNGYPPMTQETYGKFERKIRLYIAKWWRADLLAISWKVWGCANEEQAPVPFCQILCTSHTENTYHNKISYIPDLVHMSLLIDAM